MYPDTTTPEGRAVRMYQFAKEKLARLKERYAKTGNKKYLHMAEIHFGEGDYIAGQDDGEERISNNQE